VATVKEFSKMRTLDRNGVRGNYRSLPLGRVVAKSDMWLRIGLGTASRLVSDQAKRERVRRGRIYAEEYPAELIKSMTGRAHKHLFMCSPVVPK
jgi:hypothetical protein